MNLWDGGGWLAPTNSSLLGLALQPSLRRRSPGKLSAEGGRQEGKRAPSPGPGGEPRTIL